MRTDLKISFHLDHFYYHNENYEWTSEMPYFWFSFFKIDGTTCRLNGSLQLEGTAVVSSPFEKMESLSNIEPDKHDVIRVPSHLGFEEFNLQPIPVPEFVKKSGINDLKAHAGCVVVLMNEDCASLDGSGTYSEILRSTLQNSLNELIPFLNYEEKNISKYLEGIRNDLESNILCESKKNQSFWKRWTTEKIVNASLWKFSSDELNRMHSMSLAQYWGTEGLWELSGELKVKKIQPEKTADIKTKSPRKRMQHTH